MSIFRLGQRVTVSFGQHHGRHGVIQSSSNENGVSVVEVLLDGDATIETFRPSMLRQEVAT